MNTQQLIGWMENPGALGKEAGAQLETLTQSFPYFQTAHLLLIKSLHNQNSFLYNNQLKVTAAYASNRKVLYELITKKSNPEVQPSTVSAEIPETVEEKTETLISKEPETPKKEAETIQPEFPKKRFVSNPDEWESGMLRQLQLLHHWKTSPGADLKIPTEKTGYSKAEEKRITEEKAEETAEQKIAEEKPTAADEINTLLYVLVEPDGAEDITATEEPETEALTENATEPVAEETAEWDVKIIEPEETETEEPLAETEIPEDPVQQEILREAISSSIELEVDDTLPSPEELVPGLKTVIPDKKPEVPVILPEKTEEKEPAPTEEPAEEMSFGAWLKQVGKTPAPKPEEKPVEPVVQKTNTLIDKFIEDAPRIRAQKNTFYSPVNMAKKSVQESDEFITETLARIYVKQGNIPKAIRAYQKLSLKFPEKTTYFAALIEELKRTSK